MSVIIRLQKLPLAANAGDIRDFFRGQSIPEGGVHIVGGRDGDAFIAFETDEDARQAMRHDGRKIKDSRVRLLLSSRVEMNRVIERARTEYASNYAVGGTFGDEPRDKERERDRGDRERDREHRRHSNSRVHDRDRDRDRERDRGARRRSRSRSPRRFAPGQRMDAAGAEDVYNMVVPEGQAPPPVTGFTSFPSAPAYGDGMTTPRGPSAYGMDTGASGSMKPYYTPEPSAAYISAPACGLGSEGFYRASPTSAGGFPPINTAGADMNAPAYSGTFGPAAMAERPVGDGASLMRMGREQTVPSRGDYQMSPEQFGQDFGLQDTDSRFRAGDRYFAGGDQRGGAPQYTSGSTGRGYNESVMESSMPNSGPQAQLQGRVSSKRTPLLAAPGLLPPARNEPESLMSMGAGVDAMNMQNPPTSYGSGLGRYGGGGRGTGSSAFQSDGQYRDDMLGGHYGDSQYGTSLGTRGPSRIDEQRPAYGRRSNDTDVFGTGGLPTYPPSNMQQSDYDRDPSGYYIVMFGVPKHFYRYGAIRDFFRPIVLDGNDCIKIVYNERGDNVNRVYCALSSQRDLEAALRKDGQLGMKIRQCSVDEFKVSAAGGPPASDMRRSQGPQPLIGKDYVPQSGCSPLLSSRPVDKINVSLYSVVEVSNIPYRCVDKDVTEFLSCASPVAVQRRYRMLNQQQVPCDVLYAIFDRDENMLAAMQLNSRLLQDRYVRVRRTTVTAMESALGMSLAAILEKGRLNGGQLSDSGPPDMRNGPMPVAVAAADSRPAVDADGVKARELKKPSCLQMFGLPQNIQTRDILNFFRSLRIVPNGVRLMKEPRNSAYVEFVSPAECEQALRKNRDYIGTQVVTLRPCSREDMMTSIHKQHGLEQAQRTCTDDYSKGNTPLSDGGGSGDAAAKAGGMETKAVNRAVTKSEDNADVQIADQRVTSSRGSNYGVPLQESAANGNQPSTSDATLMPIKEVTQSIVRSIGPPGCVVALRNLPSNTEVSDIIKLFAGYRVIDDTMRMHISHTGESTGDCLLALATPDQARDAVRRLNGIRVEGRAIGICLMK